MDRVSSDVPGSSLDARQTSLEAGNLTARESRSSMAQPPAPELHTGKGVALGRRKGRNLSRLPLVLLLRPAGVWRRGCGVAACHPQRKLGEIRQGFSESFYKCLLRLQAYGAGDVESLPVILQRAVYLCLLHCVPITALLFAVCF